MLDYISFKLILNLFEILKKNKITVKNIQIQTYDRSKFKILTFTNYTDLNTYFNLNFKRNCQVKIVGNLVGFITESNLYNFDLGFNFMDICDKPKIVSLQSFDNDRDNLRVILKDKQKQTILSYMQIYCKYSKETNNVYKQGIYSPCFAEPGWSEGTGLLWEIYNKIHNNKTFII